MPCFSAIFTLGRLPSTQQLVSYFSLLSACVTFAVSLLLTNLEKTSVDLCESYNSIITYQCGRVKFLSTSLRMFGENIAKPLANATFMFSECWAFLETS